MKRKDKRGDMKRENRICDRGDFVRDCLRINRTLNVANIRLLFSRGGGKKGRSSRVA